MSGAIWIFASVGNWRSPASGSLGGPLARARESVHISQAKLECCYVRYNNPPPCEDSLHTHIELGWCVRHNNATSVRGKNLI